MIVPFCIIIFSAEIKAQTVSDFEDLSLPVDSFWNGSDFSGFFVDGNARFTNYFVDWGGGLTSWSGFSYSNMRDTITQSYANEFSAITAYGYNSSVNYAVCYVSAYAVLPDIKLNSIADGDTVGGFYVTNTTYGFLTMKNGGGPAKKFGGVTGTDPDWFALVVYGFDNGVKKPDSVMFYLADYRFASSVDDYIVKDWRWVDLTSLGKVDSLTFKMYSSDTGSFGINNPTYFCMDNLTTNYHTAGIDETTAGNLNVYPNPAGNYISIGNLSPGSQIHIFDCYGKEMKFSGTLNGIIDISWFPGGMYLLNVFDGKTRYCSKFIKE